jgi:integrase
VPKYRTRSMRHLELKRRIWWFNQGVPRDVQHYFDGKTHYRANLKTGDLRTAMERRDRTERECRDLFKQIRSGVVVTSAEEMAEHRGSLYREALAQLGDDPKANYADEGEWSEYDLAVSAAEDEHERGRGRPKERFAKAFAGEHPIDKFLDPYLTEANLAPKTTNERRGLVRRFAKWCLAEGLSLQDISRKNAGRYVSEMIAPMHPRTGKKHMTAVREYWAYLARRAHVSFEQTGNPWNDQLQPQRGRKAYAGKDDPERHFTAEEVVRLLHDVSEGGEGQFDGITREVTTIGLLSGMREAEIVTLRVADIVDGGDGAGTVFDLKDAKTRAGLRKVPVHPDLMALVEQRKNDPKTGKAKKPNEWLFHEMAHLPNPGDAFGKRFKLFRLARDVDDRRAGRRRSLVNFHSTRKWFVTEAERAGQPESTVEVVVGHASERKKKITFGVYSGGPSGKQRRECVEAVKLPQPPLAS